MGPRRGGLFAQYQPRYAEHGVATFPVNDNKRPAVSNYLRMGLQASRRLTEKFCDADGLGFACGERSGITVLDVDSPDERLGIGTMARGGASVPTDNGLSTF